MYFNTFKIIKIALGIMMTFFWVRMFVQFLFSDFLSSLMPGWHTTILPESEQLSIIAVYVLATSLNVVLFYMTSQKLLSLLFDKIDQK